MKIRNAQSPTAIDAARRSDGDRATPPGPARAEEVRVSAEARSLMEARAPEAPDEAKVASLKKAIRDGMFAIDPSRIADMMLREEL